MINAQGKTIESERAWIDTSAAARRISVYAILMPAKDMTVGKKMAGKVLVHYPADGMGRLTVNLYDWSNSAGISEVGYGSASGCGYDKITAAMAGLKFADHVLEDHGGHNSIGGWSHQIAALGYDVYQLI